MVINRAHFVSLSNVREFIKILIYPLRDFRPSINPHYSSRDLASTTVSCHLIRAIIRTITGMEFMFLSVQISQEAKIYPILYRTTRITLLEWVKPPKLIRNPKLYWLIFERKITFVNVVST